MIALLARLFTRGEPALSEAGADDAAAIATLHGASFRQRLERGRSRAPAAPTAASTPIAPCSGGSWSGFILSRVAADEAEILSVAIAASRQAAAAWPAGCFVSISTA